MIWESEKIFFDGDEYFTLLQEDIERAHSLITVEMYIFHDDHLGRRILQSLIEAHGRGVRVLVLVDGVGSFDFAHHLAPLLDKTGVRFKFFNPLPFYHPYYGNLSFHRKIQVLFTRLLRMNQRDHRKMITIDENILYTGSFNISAMHVRSPAGIPWKDMGVRVTGAPVKFAVLSFKRNWKLRDFLKYRKKMKELRSLKKIIPLRLNHNLAMRKLYLENFIRRINRAEDKVWFMSPYFVPKNRVIRALAKAAKRGVDVRLLLSAESDVKLFYFLQSYYYPYLIKAGVKIFLYGDSILHAKNYIIDDWMTIGSSNLNHRSVIHDLEVDLVISGPENHHKILEHFRGCAREENLVREENLEKISFLYKMMGKIFFMFRYWF